MAQVAAGLVRDKSDKVEIHSIIESFGIQTLKAYPQNVAFNVGDPAGNFLMTKKMPDGSIHTKIMERKNGKPETTWIRRDSAGNTIQFETTLDDIYDPRTRPWYRGAAKSAGVFWTEAYIFFTDQRPGVTVALAVRDAEHQLKAVISLDILLEELSAFLNRLQIGSTGAAMIIYSLGHLIAYPVMDRMIKRQGKQLLPMPLSELGDPVLTRAYDRSRIEKHGDED
jgi:hypothetical protein